ncbi:MAG: hypothetical protein CMG61_06340 [Candidatus Marinimicrobia bacterium]|nr:hypothetical protein [Candidatus Neomarinimicrobiota bacterium]|tara:strand:+ start:42346 stop:43056 length:711 start_codon:yes stop_codon:yes gene_type:complete
MRLNKYLARCGLGSRRKCDSFIEQGLIKINGKRIKDFSIKVSQNDFVQFKNRILNFVEENYLYIVNKPRGYVSTLDDPKGRKKVIDLIDSNIRLFNIGRLDYNSTGLILFTNNGDISNILLRPENKLIKKYYVETDGKLSKDDIFLIKKGFKIPDFGMVKADISFLESAKKEYYIWDVKLTEGKNREIKRIFSYFDISVNKLHRYEFAGIKLGNIKSGKYKRISFKQIENIVTLKK